MFCRICNPTALNISICNAIKEFRDYKSLYSNVRITNPHERRCYSTQAPLLLHTSATATPHKRRCYSTQTPMLLHTSATATPHKRHCYSTQTPMLLHTNVAATPHERHCHSTQASLPLHTNADATPHKRHCHSTRTPFQPEGYIKKQFPAHRYVPGIEKKR